MLSCPNQTKASCLPFPIWHAEGKRDSPFLNMCLLMFKGWALLSTDQFTEHFSRDLSFSVSRQQINNVTSPQSKTFLKTVREEQEYTEGQGIQFQQLNLGTKGVWSESSWGSDSALEWVESPSSWALTRLTPSSKVSNSNILIFGTKSIFGAAEASQMPKQNKQGTE